ncbi:periostin [Clonorchis sinensis]|uniref:Periostin n=1 Tax=Clonorchis sinensis TaxID=79923 RepID=G7Y870_CLOSI|nr:periostin [Clonorchis sinensis]
MMNEMKVWIGLLTVLLTSRLLQGQDYKYSQQFGDLNYADPDSAGKYIRKYAKVFAVRYGGSVFPNEAFSTEPEEFRKGCLLIQTPHIKRWKTELQIGLEGDVKRKCQNTVTSLLPKWYVKRRIPGSSLDSRVKALCAEENDQTAAQIQVTNRLQETGYPMSKISQLPCTNDAAFEGAEKTPSHRLFSWFQLSCFVYHLLIRNAFPSLTNSASYRQCAYWELPDGTHLHSECDPYNMERCGETAQFIYKCCSGFEEDPDTFGGYRRQQPIKCSRMISPYNECAETILKSAEVAPFSPDLSAVSELKNEEAEGPFTIFAPKMDEDDGPIEASEHVVRGRFYAEDLKEGMELETVDGRRKLYVSRFGYGVLGIDCAEITDVDLECRSGVIHKIRHPLNGRGTFTNTDRTSVMSLLQSHPETQAFADDLPSDLKRELGAVYSGKRYTVLAPRTQAWNDIKRQFTGEKLQQIAARHVLPNQICSGALVSKVNQKSNVLGDKVNIICTVDKQSSQEKRYIMTECDEKINLIETDMAAANGVVHLLEKAITPLTTKMLLENEKCAKALKVNEFVKLMKECNLYMDDNNKYAVILPRDESFQWWSSYEQFREEYQRFQVDKEYRCKVARYHIVKSNDKLDSMESFASHTMGHRTNNMNDYLYETTYFTKTPQGPMLNFHYSPIPDMTALTVDNMAIYITPRINVPPEKNLTDILQERPDTTLTNRKTIDAEMDAKHFQKNAPGNLYLVTTDDGWKDPRASAQSLNPYRPENTMYQGETLEKFLLLHHVPLYLWGGDIGYFPPNSVHKFMSSAGVELTFWRDASGVMRIGHDEMPRNQWPKVVKWNLPARDGIIWLLDGILQCPSTLCPLYAEDIDYYDMFVAACQTAHLPGEANAADDFRKKPTDVATRHPDDCTVVLQLSEQSMRYVEA